MATRDMPDGTRWWRERPVETERYQSAGLRAAFTYTTLCHVDEDCVLHYLEMATDNATQCYFYIYPLLRDGTYPAALMLINRNGSTTHGLNMSNLNTHISGLFDILVYDAVNNRYKACTAQPIRFAHGLHITLFNAIGAARNVGAQALVEKKGIIP